MKTAPADGSDAGSRRPSKRGKGKPLYYGWIVLGACLLVGIVAVGTRYSFGVFLKALEGDFGWTRATTSGAFSLYMVFSSFFALLGGWALDRYGPRLLVAVSGFFTALSLLLTSQVHSLWQLYISYSLLLALGTGAIYTLLVATALRWFTGQRGLAVGVVGSGASLGTIVMAPLSALLIASYGWRTSYLVMALMALITMIAGAFLLKRSPGAPGAVPGGQTESVAQRGLEDRQGGGHTGEPRLRDVFVDKNFWLLFAVWLLYSFCVHLVITQVVPHATDIGISPLRAATVLTVIGGFSIPGRVLMGRVSDRVGRRKTAITAALLMTGAMLWLNGATSVWMFYLFGMFFGIAYGGLDSPTTALVGDLFGLRRIGTIIGALVLGWGAGAALGPALGGYAFDVWDSYSVAFLAGAAGMALAAGLVLLLRVPEQRDTDHA